MDLSIIIVNWNTREILRNCLASVYRDAAGAAWEVIVVDNGSSDGSTEMVEREFGQVRLIKNTDNKGFAAANNQGMKVAAGRYILLLNSDTIVLDNAIAKTIEAADGRPRAAVVGCKVLNPDWTVQRTCFMFPSLLNMMLSSTYLYKLFPSSRFFGRERMTWWDRADTREVEVITGCFMLVRRETIEQVGLMDEQYFIYGEETDWCRRFREAGWQCIFIPAGEIIHLGGQSARMQPGPMMLQLRGSILLFFKKHKSAAQYAAACCLTALFFSARLPWWSAMAILRPAQVSVRNRCYYYFKGVVGALRGASALCVRRSGV